MLRGYPSPDWSYIPARSQISPTVDCLKRRLTKISESN